MEFQKHKQKKKNNRRVQIRTICSLDQKGKGLGKKDIKVYCLTFLILKDLFIYI